MKITAIQGSHREVSVSIKNGSVECGFTFYPESKVAFIDVPKLESISIREDVPIYNAINDQINMLNKVSFILTEAKKRFLDKGFIWSEMRKKCEIEVEFVEGEWKLTYRKTGMPQAETIFCEDGTLYRLFGVINKCLFD